MSAVSGGVTTICDMPNTNPATMTMERLEEKKKSAAEKSLCNYGFYFGAGRNADVIRGISDVPGLKVYMNMTTGDLIIEDDEKLKSIFEASPVPILLHAEGATFKHAIDLIKPLGKHIHLCHLSLASEVNLVRELKAEGYPVTCEVMPHHAFMNAETENPLATMKPPLESPEDQKVLWEAINDGTIDIIATDHAPHTLAEKEQEKPAFGIPGVETSFPLFLNAVKEGKMKLSRLVTMMCENPATFLRQTKKGFIKEGYDADLTLVNLEEKWSITHENQHSKCGWTAYSDTPVTGKVIKTWVGGKLAFDEGVIHEEVRGKGLKF